MDCIQNFFIFLIDKYNVQSYNKNISGDVHQKRIKTR